MTSSDRSSSTITRALRAVLCAVALATSGAPATLLADTQMFNGTWTLDAERSGNFEGLLEDFNDHLLEHQKKKKIEGHGAFSGLGGELAANNPYMGRESDQKASLKRKERVKVKPWELAPDVRALLDARAIKLYQAEKCSILYDEGTKRLVTIIPDGEARTLQSRPSTHDAIGRSTSYFDGSNLIIDTDTEAGDRLVETFTLDAAGRELTLVTKIRRSDVGKPIEFKRVFARSE